MKTYVYIATLFLPFLMIGNVSATVVTSPCSGFPSSGGCETCFYETQKLYGCNPHQTSCIKDDVINLNDTSINTGSVDLVQYDPYDATYNMGSISGTNLQSAHVDWGWSEAAFLDMFQTPAEFSEPATPTDPTGYQQFGSGRYGYLLEPGDTVKWIEMKPGAFMRPDTIQSSTNPASPVYKTVFTPRLFSDTTSYIDHPQCIYHYVRYCGDGDIDGEKGEQCDDGNMTSGDGCSNTCQTETVPATCDSLTISPTVVQGETSVSYSCNATNATSYTLQLFDPSNTLIETLTNASGMFTVPATPDGTYRARCTVNGSITSPACEKTVLNNPETPGTSCDNLAISPSTVEGTTNVSYACSSTNATSFTLQLFNPSNVVIQTLTSATGSFSVPATPDGTYRARCTVDGSITSPACEKTIQNNPPASNPTCNALTIAPSVIQGTTNVAYYCDATDATSYTLQLFNPSNVVIQTLTNSSGSFSVPGTPDGIYRARCTINGSITSPSCEKTIQNDPDTPPATCNALTATPTTITGQTSVYFSCNATNATSYYIELRNPNNTIIGNIFSPTGSIVLPATPDGTYTARCTVDNTITNNNCTTTITNNAQQQPEIEVIKDDQDTPHNDYQLVQIGGNALFTVTVRNIGQESINNITLSDTLTPECNRSSIQTQSIMTAAGLGTTLDPGESFEYTCQKNNISNTTFPQNTNTVCVTGFGSSSGIQDTDCDDTYITPSQTDPAIQIIKDDSDNHDDRQYIAQYETATFDITVYNIGDEKLENVAISDQYAANCVRSDSSTRNLIDNIGNDDTFLDPGESFTYTCSRSNVSNATFPNNQNTACVQARGYRSNKSVSDCDPTYVFTSDPQPAINIIKDDADNYDDTQNLVTGGRARFTIIVENTGDEVLENVSIDDPRAPDCDRTSSQTRSLFPGSTFDPGEKFTYQCDRSNVRSSMFPNDENVACVQARGEVSNDYVDDCDPTRVRFESSNRDPSIRIIKDDADNHDDKQYIISGEVRFDITVKNDGDAPLEDIVITDEFARECSRSDSQTRGMYSGNVFDPNERIRYTCRVFDAKMTDYPTGKNRICVRGKQVGSSKTVSDCDDTLIRQKQEVNGFCTDLVVSSDHGVNQLKADFICLGNAQKEFYLDILTPDGKLLKTIRDDDGRVTHTFGIGNYKTRCRIDNQTSVSPACEKRISVERENICMNVRTSNGNAGPTGFQTNISCDARPGDRCEIQVKEAATGRIKKTYNVCSRNLKFSREGEYEIQCVVNGKGGNQCSTDITIQNPTTPETGAFGIFAGTILCLTIGSGVYYYRRRRV